ncbi:hypothetical protein [Streptomyces sp. PSKA30]|uniref:hypothetical protein n=1 Tax=Streptomyces sp. PSKA30 TaxID=2874597 RepID=UPI001CD0B21A|nr:hypothetical protein [Streptomyces sp. PSKA30]MBZ9642692.1 hypothetical protein [Streptomyces sp. PSKA30]
MPDSLAIAFLYVTLALLVAFFVLWVIIDQRKKIESGWTEWCRTAKALPWRDRWELYRATLRGRAVSDPRLAAPAVQRAERYHAWTDSSIRPSTTRWFGLGFAVLSLLGLFLALIGGAASWFDYRLGGALVGGALGGLLTYPWYALLRKQAQRCIDANRYAASLEEPSRNAEL